MSEFFRLGSRFIAGAGYEIRQVLARPTRINSRLPGGSIGFCPCPETRQGVGWKLTLAPCLMGLRQTSWHLQQQVALP